MTDAPWMTQAMRWFGPADPVSLRDIRQAGATEVVTALHQVPIGEEWTPNAIAERMALVRAGGLGWTVVESLPVAEAIKTDSAGCDRALDAYRRSLANLAAAGISVVTYNFMPLLDWTRTDLAFAMPDGALALRFDWEAVAAFDLHILQRAGAEGDYTRDVVAGAGARFRAMAAGDRDTLAGAILAGLPGSEQGFDLAGFARALQTYRDVDADRLRDNHARFLEAVCPVADDLGLRLVVHPDDPPFPIFGLPRVVSTAADLDRLFARVPNPSNGLCFCTGSLGARPDNDLPVMMERFGPRIGFLHLRNINPENNRSFHESAHLDGAIDMVAVMQAIHRLSRLQNRSIPMRPDHGHQMLDDLSKVLNPGYSAIGRLRGLAELRGLERGVAAGLS